MKTQIKINLALAATGSLLFSLIAMLDPNVAWRDCIGVHIGIWAMALGQCWTQFILNDKTTHEKEHHPTPAP